MNTKTLLIIEDDPKIAELIKLYAEQEGYRTLHCDNGEDGLNLALNSQPTALLLDLMIPKLNGLEVLKALRAQSRVPVLIITAKSEELDTILGLELGADDFITKPFSPKELMARLKAVLRRSVFKEGPQQEAFTFADLHIVPEKMSVEQDGKSVELSALEFKLLTTLARHPGRVYSREQLIQELYESEHHLVYDRTIDAHIKKLRKKLKDRPKQPRYIESVFGVGYKAKEL